MAVCRVCDTEVPHFVTARFGTQDIYVCFACAAKLKDGVFAMRDAAVLGLRAYLRNKAPNAFDAAAAVFKIWQQTRQGVQ